MSDKLNPVEEQLQFLWVPKQQICGFISGFEKVHESLDDL